MWHLFERHMRQSGCLEVDRSQETPDVYNLKGQIDVKDFISFKFNITFKIIEVSIEIKLSFL